MHSSIRRYLPLSLLAAVLPAATVLADVRDNGSFFSPGAVQQADDVMSRIEQDHHKQFVVETFNGIPDDAKAQFDPSQKEQFFQHWANDRAKALKVNGVYVLVNRDPSYLQAEVGPETQQRAFTIADRDELKAEMLNDFKQKKFDDGLVQGANFVQKQMNAHLGTAGGATAGGVVGASSSSSGSSGSSGNTTNYPTAPQAQSHGFFGSVFGLVVLVGAVLIGISLIRRLVGRNQQGYGGGYGYGNRPMSGGVPPVPPQGGYGPGYGQPYNQGQSGGGFGRGLLGGLLGGAAGGYLYDKVAHPGQTGGGWTGGQAQGAPPAGNSGTNGIDTGTDVGGGDFSGSGGDFGGGGGGAGADFGSSDSGGGGGGGGGGGDAGGGGDSGGGSF